MSLLKEYDTPFASQTADRVDHYAELGDIEYEDLGIVLSPWYREYEDVKADNQLPYEEQHWQVHVHARDLGKLRDEALETEYRFDAVVGYENATSEDFLEVEFPTWVKVFEDRFEDSELYFPDYDVDSIF